ncbi:MipA/OmpV family protein [Caldimonas caldifontis]|nr:MipA/OmpV family protein [Caldimonas caldifontis]
MRMWWSCALVSGACALALQAWAEPLPERRSVERPLWEAGLGLGGLSLPDYRGAATRSNYVLPLPYVVYRGDWLRADRDGARAVLVDAPSWAIDLSLAGSPPARGRSEGIRAGMDDLPATFEIGPNASINLWRTARRDLQLQLRLPLRAVFTLERSPRSAGAVFQPHLHLDSPSLNGGWRLSLQTGPVYGTAAHHRHYYGVAASEALPERPAYQARAGYGGWQTLGAVSRRIGAHWVGAFVRHDHVGGAVFADSPLVERRSGWSVGLGWAMVLGRSAQTVTVYE